VLQEMMKSLNQLQGFRKGTVKNEAQLQTEGVNKD
jgi:hypothetical protein